PSSSDKIKGAVGNMSITSSLVASFINADITASAVIRSQIHEAINHFDGNHISFESVQELAVLATVPDKDIFLHITRQIAKVLQHSPILPNLVFRGLAVILSSCPEQIDLSN
ncbi:hypothetical protein BGX27_005499, partial [Mortierella sp. AM989]